MRFHDNIMNFLLGIILKTLWLAVKGTREISIQQDVELV